MIFHLLNSKPEYYVYTPRIYDRAYDIVKGNEDEGFQNLWPQLKKGKIWFIPIFTNKALIPKELVKVPNQTYSSLLVINYFWKSIYLFC